MSDIAARFTRDTANHTMIVLHDDGLYRHLRFQDTTWRPPLTKPLKSSFYWFDLITAPGTMIFEGDGESYVFRREEDMIGFFRSSAYKGRPNLHYWQERSPATDARSESSTRNCSPRPFGSISLS